MKYFVGWQYTFEFIQYDIIMLFSCYGKNMRKLILSLQTDRTFTFATNNPPTTYFLKQAAGIEKGAHKTGMQIAYYLAKYSICNIKVLPSHFILYTCYSKELCTVRQGIFEEMKFHGSQKMLKFVRVEFLWNVF